MINKYWLVLIKDFAFMESMFLLSLDMFLCADLCRVPYKDRDDMVNLRDNLNEYFYVDNPDKYDVDMLRKFAKFKNVKKNYKMKRSLLIRNLRRDPEKLYYVP